MRYTIPTGKKLVVPSGACLAVPATPPIDYAVSCAFGLRTLVVGYSGPLIRLRRDSDDAESDFSAVEGVLDTAAIATWLGAANGLVYKWYDQSGNGRDIVNATNDNQPLFVASYNGKPAILNSASDYLQATGFSVSQPRTVNVVFAHTASSIEYLLDSASASGRSIVSTQASPAGALRIYAGSGSIVGTTSIYGGATFVAHTEFNGASSEIWLNNSSEVIGNPGAHAMIGISAGSAYDGSANWLGHIMEIIVVDSVLSDGARTDLFGNQNIYYGVS